VSWLRHDFVITHFHTSSERQSAIWTKTGEPMTALPIKEEGDTTIWQEFNSTVTGYSHNPLSQSDKHPVTNCLLSLDTPAFHVVRGSGVVLLAREGEQV